MKKVFILLMIIGFLVGGLGIAGAVAPDTQIPIKYKHGLTYPKKYKLRFSLWTGDEEDPAATEVWSEGDTPGDITKTLTSDKIKHVLGSLVPLHPADFVDQLWVQIERWKGKTSSWVVIGPRMELAVVPYAIQSAIIAANAVGSSEVADNSLTANDLATNSVGAAEIAANAVGASEIARHAITPLTHVNWAAGNPAVISSSCGTFVPAQICPVGFNDMQGCDVAQPGTFCEYDSGCTLLGNNLNNCPGLLDVYFRTF